jgi:hypothetical protein
MANQSQQQPQSQAGQQPQQQQQAHQQAAQALQQYGAAHGLPSFNWQTLLPILIQLIQALSQGGGVQPQAQAGQPKTP